MFQFLISTVNNKFLNSNKKNESYLIINQLLDKTLNKVDENNICSYYEKGLSKSRNRAIENAKAEICLISDDDVVFKQDIAQIILNVFEENPDADIITFQIETPDGKKFKDYGTAQFWHNMRTLMKVSSIEIAFRKKSIINNNIKFDESFGLGTEFPTGEEIIFLSDAIKKGLKILYIPIPIVIHPFESSGKNYDNLNLIQAKGAMFYRIFGNLSYIISIIFALKKYKLSKYSFLKFTNLILKGILKYKRLIYAK